MNLTATAVDERAASPELSLPRTRRAALAELAALQAEVERRSLPHKIEATLPSKVRASMLRPMRYKGLKGGRGGAKSHSFARMLIARALRQKGLRWLCGREIQNSLRESVKRLLEDVIIEFEVGKYFDIYDTKIVTPGGGSIIFQGLQSHTSESIKSLERLNGAWIEEAHSLSERSLKLLRPTIREDNSELWFSWNPERATDPIDELLCGKMPPTDAIVVEINWQDNPHFPDVLRAEMERDYARDPDLAAHVWGGKYAVRSKASVFKNWRIYSFATPEDAIFLFGGDWGFSTDPTVLARGFIAEGELLKQLQRELGVGDRVLCIDAAVYQVGCEIDDTPALFDAIDDSRPGMAREWEIIADSARPETISYMQRHGYPRIVPARKGAGSVEEGIKFLQSYDIVIHPQCCWQCGDGKNHVQDEFEAYKYKVDPKTEVVLPILEDKKNHVIDSVRYMVEKMHLGKEWVSW